MSRTISTVLITFCKNSELCLSVLVCEARGEEISSHHLTHSRDEMCGDNRQRPCCSDEAVDPL